MGKGREFINFISQDKFSEAKGVLKDVVADNLATRVEASQMELGLTLEKFSKKKKGEKETEKEEDTENKEHEEEETEDEEKKERKTGKEEDEEEDSEDDDKE